MLTMYDAVNIDHIPAGAAMVAGYVNGIWPTYDTLVKKFPHAHHVSITVHSHAVADVLDVEKGDASPADVPQWVLDMRGVHKVPIIYCSASNVSAVRAACTAERVLEPFFWVADWTNVPHLYPGSIATQWADGTEVYPGDARGTDTSLVSPNWPGLKTPTKAAATVHKILHPVHKVAALPTVRTKPEPTTTPTNTSPKGPTMISITQLEGWLRKFGSYAVILNDFTNTSHLTPQIKAVLTSVAGVILSIEHYATKPKA